MQTVRFYLTTALLAATVGCSSGNNSDDGLVGEAKVYLSYAPTDAICLRITVSGVSRRVENLFELSTTQSSVFSLKRLPLGSDMFTGLAFGTPCDSVSSKSVPTWQSDPVMSTVSLNQIANVALVMRRSVGQAKVAVDFEDDDSEDGGDIGEGTVIYDAAKDFSFVNNPNRAWSYGFTSALGGNLSLYTNKTTNDFGVDCWYGSDPVHWTPGVGKNESGKTLTNVENSITFAPGDMVFHPNSNGENSVVRWTAPAAGTCTIDASFALIDQQAKDVDVHVMHNGSSIFDSVVSGYLDSQSYSSASPITVAKNDTIDFVVGVGPGGDFWDDTTRLNATIKLTVGGFEDDDLPLLQNPSNGHWYGLFDQNCSWHEARDFCQMKGGYLATLANQDENDFVLNRLLATGPYVGWLGATDEVSEGTWVWVTGEPFSWTNWRGGEPNDRCENEDYLMMWDKSSGGGFSGLWNDVDTAIVEDGYGGFCAVCESCSGPVRQMVPICEWNSEP